MVLFIDTPSEDGASVLQEALQKRGGGGRLGGECRDRCLKLLGDYFFGCTSISVATLFCPLLL